MIRTLFFYALFCLCGFGTLLVASPERITNAAASPAGLYDAYEQFRTIRPLHRYQLRYPFPTMYEQKNTQQSIAPHLWQWLPRNIEELSYEVASLKWDFDDVSDAACEQWDDNAWYVKHFDNLQLRKHLYKRCLRDIFIQLCADIDIDPDAFDHSVISLGGTAEDARNVLSASLLHFVRVLLSNPHATLAGRYYRATSIEAVKGLRPYVKALVLSSPQIRATLHSQLFALCDACDRSMDKAPVVAQVLSIVGLIDEIDKQKSMGVIRTAFERLGSVAPSPMLGAASRMVRAGTAVQNAPDACASRVTSYTTINAYSDFIDAVFDMLPEAAYDLILMKLEARMRFTISHKMKWYERAAVYWLFGYE